VPRLRPRAFGLSLGALLFFAIGTSVQAGWLLVFAACLLGAVIAGCVVPVGMVRRIEIERRAPAEAFQGDRIDVDLILSNRGRGARLAMVVDDTHLTPTRVFLRRLDPGASIGVTTSRVASRRGIHRSSEVTVSSAAPFGVVERRRRFSVPGETVVYPALVPLGDLPFLGASPTAERALHAVPRRGGGPDYLGIREYRWGDSMRHVHWPSTARHGELMVREFEREETRRLAIVLDTSADAGEASTPLDRCCSVAASVALSARGRGQGVRLVAAVNGEPTILSRAEPETILRWLAGLRADAGMTMSELLAELGPELQGTDTVLVALPTWKANAAGALADRVDDLGNRVSRLIAVLVDAGTFASVTERAILSLPELDLLEDVLATRGVLVARVGAEGDLAATLGRLPAGASR
jgi:uncharacterized protein (DUF58 family)